MNGIKNRSFILRQHKGIKDLFSRGAFISLLYFLSTINIIIIIPLFKKVPFASFIDEIVVMSLLIYGFFHPYIFKRKEIAFTFFVLLLYLGYSLMIGVNKPIAAIYDFLIFLKPFIVFYVVKHSSFFISKDLKKILKWLYLILGGYCWAITPFLYNIYSNTTKFYPACILCAVSYFFFSEKKQRDWIIALCMLIPGLLTIRAKFYTEFVFFVFVVFFLRKKIHFNLKWIIVFSLLASISIYISWEKFSQYFIYGEEDGAARTILYVNSIDVAKKYLPFGAGFGTYGTESAAKFYSPLYHRYGIDNIRGLREVDYGDSGHNYLTDTFYPVVWAQFGIGGFFLFFVFWYKRCKELLDLEMESYKMCAFILFVEFIQNIASNSFSGPFGLPCMMMIAFLLKNRSYVTNNVKL